MYTQHWPRAESHGSEIRRDTSGSTSGRSKRSDGDENAIARDIFDLCGERPAFLKKDGGKTQRVDVSLSFFLVSSSLFFPRPSEQQRDDAKLGEKISRDSAKRSTRYRPHSKLVETFDGV